MSSFIEHIVKIISEKKCSILDAMLLFSEKTGLDEESMATLIKREPLLLSKLEEEATANNLLKNKPSSNLEIFM